MAKEVCISIPNWNGQNVLEECLDSIFANTQYSNFNITVVDNGSTDDSVEMINEKFPEVSIIHNDTNKGFAKANNQVFQSASEQSSDYVLMLNNDIEILEKGWLTKLVEVAEFNDSIGVVGGHVVEPDGSSHYSGRFFPFHDFLAWPGLEKRMAYNTFQDEELPGNCRYVDDVVGALYLIDMDVIDDIGGLDEKYSPAYFEESDFSVRVWNAGYKIVYTPDVEVLHLRHQSSSKFDPLWLDSLLLQNYMRFIFTNYPLDWIILAIPYIVYRMSLLFIDYDGVPSIRNEAINRPIDAMNYAISPFWATIKGLPDMVSKRQQRRNIKQLLK